MNNQPQIYKFLIPIIAVPFLLLFIPFLSRHPLPAPVPATQPPAQTQPPVIPASQAQPAQAVELQGTQAEVSAKPIPSPTPILDVPSPIEKALDESRKRREKARSAYQRLVSEIDAGSLTSFGGKDWTQIQSLEREAESTEQPDLAIERLAEAHSRLEKLRGELPTRQRLQEIQKLQLEGRYLEFLNAIAAKQSGSRLPVDSFWSDITGWDSTRWMALARQEVDAMAPDDPGFAEIMLVVADFHASHGDIDETRRANEQAWTRLARMTNAHRAAESAIIVLQRLLPSLPESRQKELLVEGAQLVSQASHLRLRIELLTDLSSMLRARGYEAEAQSLLDKAIADSQNSKLQLSEYWPYILRCRALSTSSSAKSIFEICVSIPKYNGSRGFDPFPANAMGYSYAAQAAVRSDNPVDVSQGVLLAEAQLLDVTGPNNDECLARRVLAEADLMQKNWRRALISAQNIAELNLRAGLVYQIMVAAPAEVPREIAFQTLNSRPTHQGATLAIAHYLPRLAADDSTRLPELLPWILKQKANSTRAAAYLGLALYAGKSAPDLGEATQLPRPVPNREDARSLLETAEFDVNLLQMPLDRAWASLWIALCWQRLDQPASYRRACQQVHDHLFDAWQGYWSGEKPENPRDPAGEYRSSQSRSKELTRILECYLTFAEAQAFLLKDAQGALATCIDAARASEHLYQTKFDPKIRLKLVYQAVHRECRLPSGLLETAFFHPNHYFPLLEAASIGDITEVERRLQLIETEGPGYNFKKEDCLARGYAELAILTARSGNLPAYQAARRKALAQIQTHGAIDSILLPIYEADAYAGEFALAAKLKSSDGPLPVYGSGARPQSALCVELSVARRSEVALKQIPPLSQPYWRMQAMHAIAAARLQHEPAVDHLAWLATLPEPIDRIAALCGLALKKPRL